MGLAERRAAKKFETERFPSLLSEIQAAAGFALPVEVAWDKLQAEGYADSYDEFWSAIYFRPLCAAFKAITIDDMGRDALKQGLQKVVVTNANGNYSSGYAYTFEDGVLTVDHEPATNVGDEQDRASSLQKLLESRL